MSAIDKAARGDVFDYHHNALPDHTAYGTFAQPPYAAHQVYPSSLPDDNNQLHYVTNSAYPTQPDGYDENRSTYADSQLRPSVQVTSVTPTGGAEHERVYVYLSTLHDLHNPPSLSISLSFGTKRVGCLVELLPYQEGPLRQYVLSTAAPPFPETGHHSFQVPLTLVMDGTTGGATSAPQAVEVGAFSYHGVSTIPQTHDLSRKRKLSSGSDDFLHISNKRASSTHLRTQDQQAFETGSNSATSPYSLPTPTNAPNRLQQGASPRVYSHHYSTSTASQASITEPSPHTPSYSPSYATINRSIQSPAVTVTPASRFSGYVSPDKASSLPPLVRTSTLSQSTSTPGSSGSSFNPYSLYPSKATLKLNGDLDSMTRDWTDKEWEVKRRLVLFTREQVGSTIHTDFKGITPEERQPTNICISCIWWEERKDFFVTSVDTISLLESLVAVRFTVEEKNRIRRNLEGFRPMTVAKSKTDSEDFFKLIMGFPSPKPRNIEKDVKVFPWKILKEALKKIIGKYSASYSSTAGAITTVASTVSACPSSRTSVSSLDSHVASRSMGLPASTAGAYNTTFARHMQRISSSTSASSDLGLLTPAPTTASYTTPPRYTYPVNNQPALSEAIATEPLTAPAGRMSSSWDFALFSGPEPIPAMTSNIQSYTYNRNISVNNTASSTQHTLYTVPYPTTSSQ